MKWKITGILLSVAVLATLWTSRVTGQETVTSTQFIAASCDVAAVMQNYDKTAAMLAELEKMSKNIETQAQEKRQAMTKLDEELEALNPESEAFINKRRELENMSINLRIFMDASQTRMTITHRQMTAAMLGEIRAITARVAARKGINLVVNSSYSPPGESPTDLVFSPRVIYANNTADITKDVLAELNAAFQASQP